MMKLANIAKRIIEAYKWKPSASQRKAFAQKMQDPEERSAYEKRKKDKEDKRRSTSKFDYNTAGGKYIPTRTQHDFVLSHGDLFKTTEEKEAADMVMSGYIMNDKVKHDYIHIVNEKMRSIT